MKRRSFALLAAVLLAAACQEGPRSDAPAVEEAWINLPAVPGRPAAAYFTLVGGAADAQLVSIVSEAAERIELHETMTGHQGMSGMRPLATVDVPAGERVAFEPGGRHAMLFGIKPSVRVGESTPLSFRFADGRTVAVEAEVRAPGDVRE